MRQLPGGRRKSEAFGDPKTLRWYDGGHGDVPTELYLTMMTLSPLGSEFTPGKQVLSQAVARKCQGWCAVTPLAGV